MRQSRSILRYEISPFPDSPAVISVTFYLYYMYRLYDLQREGPLEEKLRKPLKLSANSADFTSFPRQTQFYKTFTRPIAKVLLVAVFTYQVAYWGWLKLEADEVRADTDGESFSS